MENGDRRRKIGKNRRNKEWVRTLSKSHIHEPKERVQNSI